METSYKRSKVGNNKKGNMKTVLVFGTFDRLHDGHHAFLEFAKSVGDRLVASVADDNVVLSMKGRLPFQNMKERIECLAKMSIVDEAVSGDLVLGNWTAINDFRPDTIVVGYDQTDLKNALEEFKMENDFKFDIVVAPSHEGHKYHTSIIHK